MLVRVNRWKALAVGIGLLAAIAVAMAWRDLASVQPAKSMRLAAWEKAGAPKDERGVALFSYGDFGAIDLDVLATSAVPWPLLAASLASNEAKGSADLATWSHVEQAFKRFGFLYPEYLVGLSGPVPAVGAPLGLWIGTVTRMMPPIRMDVLNVGCAACHPARPIAAMARRSARAAPGMPNTSLDLEAFTTAGYGP